MSLEYFSVMENLSLIVTVLVIISKYVTQGEIVGAFVMPHGGIALDPTQFQTSSLQAKTEAWVLHDALTKAGQLVGSLQPDLLFLTTPHGVADLTRFSFYLNSQGSGYVTFDECKHCFNITVDMDMDTSNLIINQLIVQCYIEPMQEMGASVSGLGAFINTEPFPLRWGEVIPLYFILPSLPATKSTRTLILSHPAREGTHVVEMIPELLSLGAALSSVLESLSERVAVIISGDLAHTHMASGPYGYSDASEPFDQAIGDWARTLDENFLLVTAASYAEQAVSCGYSGFVMLQGLMDAQGGVEHWKSEVYANLHPSYFGMMVAAFNKQFG